MKSTRLRYAFLASFSVFLPCHHSLASEPSHKREVTIVSRRSEVDHHHSSKFILGSHHVTGINNHEQFDNEKNNERRMNVLNTFNPAGKLKSIVATTFLPSGYPKKTPCRHQFFKQK